MTDLRRALAAYGVTRYWYVIRDDWKEDSLRVFRHGGHNCLFRVELGSPLLTTTKSTICSFVGPDPATENDYPLIPCRKCHDYPCRCLRDEMESE